LAQSGLRPPIALAGPAHWESRTSNRRPLCLMSSGFAPETSTHLRHALVRHTRRVAGYVACRGDKNNETQEDDRHAMGACAHHRAADPSTACGREAVRLAR